jgi:hypothetical protein
MAEQKNEQERARLRDGDWITVVSQDTYAGISDSEIAILTSEQQKLLDEGADPDDDELGDVEVYPIEDLLKWAIANGYFDYPPEERAARNE